MITTIFGQLNVGTTDLFYYRKRDCRLCGEKFGNQRKLAAHMKKAHDSAKEPDYQHCDRGFVKNPSYIQHLKEHAGTRILDLNLNSL